MLGKYKFSTIVAIIDSLVRLGQKPALEKISRRDWELLF